MGKKWQNLDKKRQLSTKNGPKTFYILKNKNIY